MSKGNKQPRKENIPKPNHVITSPGIKKTRKSQKHWNCLSTCLVTSSNLEIEAHIRVSKSYKTPELSLPFK